MPINTTRYRYRDLSSGQREELDGQIVELTDAFVEDVVNLQAGRDFSTTTMFDYLPRQFLPYYNLAFAKRFLVAFLTITWKLKDPAGVHVCANQAEEIALFTLIRATEQNLPPDDALDSFSSTVFEDEDFLSLFDPAMDGIAEALAPVDPSFTAFHVKDWFELFNDRDRPVHPYQLLAPRPIAGRSSDSDRS